MPRNIHVGVGGVARRVTRMYIGVNGVARRVTKGYIGVGGVARQMFPRAVASSDIVSGSSLTMQHVRNRVSGQAHGGAMLPSYAVIGGGSANPPVTSVDAWNSSLVRSNAGVLSEGGTAGTGSHNNQVTFAGGGAANTSNRVNHYNDQLSRTTGTTLAAANRGPAVTNIGTTLIVAGGGTGASTNGVVDRVETYNASNVKGSATALQQRRNMAIAATNGSTALITGGTNYIGGSSTSTTMRNHVDIYNSSLTRSTGTTLSETKSDHGGAYVGTHFIFAAGITISGGTGSSDHTFGTRNSVNAYDSSLVRSILAVAPVAGRTEGISVGSNSLAIFVRNTSANHAYSYNASLVRTTVPFTMTPTNDVFYLATIGNSVLIADRTTTTVRRFTF